MPDATVDKVESMFLDPMHITDGEGTTSNKVGPGGSRLEGWDIRDGRAWFSKKFPSRVSLVKHEEVWVVIRADRTSQT